MLGCSQEHPDLENIYIYIYIIIKLAGVVCVGKLGIQSINCCSIVMLHVFYGAYFLSYMRLIGCCRQC